MGREKERGIGRILGFVLSIWKLVVGKVLGVGGFEMFGIDRRIFF